MVEVARLSLTADTTGLKSAVPVLDNLVAAGKRAQTTSAQLRAQIAQTDAELRKLKASGSGTSSEINKLASSLTDLRVKLASSKAESMGLANEMQAMKSASSVAGSSVGNLTAQLFDIGVMMQAGQNPFVLMIQQGSQIAQVMGPMGAKGAIAALGASVAQLINPMNLAIFAVIGISAAVVPMIANFFMGGEAAKSLTDSVGELSDQVDSYVASSEKVRMSSEGMVEAYGKESLAIRKLLADLAEYEERKTMAAARAAAESAKSEIGIFDGSEFGVGNQKNLADMFDLSIWSSEARGHINDVLAAFEELNQAGTMREQLAAAEALRSQFEQLAMASGQVSDAEAAILQPLTEMVLELERAVGEQDRLSVSVEDTKARAEALGAVASDINSTIASADGTALQNAFAGAFPLANQLLGMAQGIVATLNQAKLDAAVKSVGTQGLASQYAQYGAGRSAFEAAAKASGPLYTPYDYPKAEDFGGGPPPGRPMDLGIGKGGAGGGGGRSQAATEAEKEAEAIQKVVDKLQSEIDMVGQSDEARRLHQELQKAGVDIYSEEGQKIAALVEELELLEAKQKLVAETMRGIENAAQGFFVGVLSGAKDLQTAIGDLLRELGNLFLNQAFKMLWEGKPGGNGGIGGWLAGLFDAGGHIPAGQVGVVAEKRPEFVDGKLVSRPTLVPGPANVTGGAATAGILDRANKAVPSFNGMGGSRHAQAPSINVAAAPVRVVVLDDPRRIDAHLRSPEGEKTAGWQRKRMGSRG